MTVHHNPNSIANVLSLKSVAQKHRVTYDSWDHGGVFKMHTENGVVEFKPSKRWLHNVDVSIDETIQHMLVTTNVMLAEEDNKKKKMETLNKLKMKDWRIAKMKILK
jgi:hypothetical protein